VNAGGSNTITAGIATATGETTVAVSVMSGAIAMKIATARAAALS